MLLRRQDVTMIVIVIVIWLLLLRRWLLLLLGRPAEVGVHWLDWLPVWVLGWLDECKRLRLRRLHVVIAINQLLLQF